MAGNYSIIVHYVLYHMLLRKPERTRVRLTHRKSQRGFHRRRVSVFRLSILYIPFSDTIQMCSRRTFVAVVEYFQTLLYLWVNVCIL